jgi:hypothetical protein
VIIGKLIPAGTGAPANVAAAQERKRRAALEALAGESLEGLAAGEEFNPFLEEGGPTRSDEDEDTDLASLLAGGEQPADAEGNDVANPFLAEAGSRSEPSDEDLAALLGADGSGSSRRALPSLVDSRPSAFSATPAGGPATARPPWFPGCGWRRSEPGRG